MKLILYSKLIDPQNKVWLSPLLNLPMGERFALGILARPLRACIREHGSPESKRRACPCTLDSPSWAWSGQWEWGPSTWGGVVLSLLLGALLLGEWALQGIPISVVLMTVLKAFVFYWGLIPHKGFISQVLNSLHVEYCMVASVVVGRRKTDFL